MKRLMETSSKGVINSLKGVFVRHGVPDYLVSDNVPHYSSGEFKQFVADNGICHLTSSPNRSSANGDAECTVSTVKGLLAADDPFLAYLNNRSSPLENGYSPADLLMGRKLSTKLPISHDSLQPIIPDMEKVNRKEFDQRYKGCNLPELHPGDPVWIKDREEPLVMEEQHPDRSYMINTPKGTLRCNRVHLKKTLSRQGTTMST